MRRIHGFLLAMATVLAFGVVQPQPPWPLFAADPAPSASNPTGLALFEAKIRPILVQHCYECHSARSKNLQGGLRVDSRAGLLNGGESGPAIVPGKAGESLLIDALRYDGIQMPPNGRLSARVVADFEQWIQIGAPMPRTPIVEITPEASHPTCTPCLPNCRPRKHPRRSRRCPGWTGQAGSL